MDERTPAPLRGDAAWRAAKEEIAKRNDAAYKRGAALRATHDERVAERRRTADRLERSMLPEQPQP